MSIKSAIIRGMIRLLWGKYPHQVRDILNEQKMHVHANPPTKREKRQREAGQMVLGTSHTEGGES